MEPRFILKITCFFYSAGTPISKGYWITNTPPVIAVNPLQAPHFGTVGPVIPGFAVKIETEMDNCFGDLAGYEVSEESLLIEIDFSIEAG